MMNCPTSFDSNNELTSSLCVCSFVSRLFLKLVNHLKYFCSLASSSIDGLYTSIGGTHVDQKSSTDIFFIVNAAESMQPKPEGVEI